MFFVFVFNSFPLIHFIYYLNRSITIKVDSTYLLAINHHHVAYMSCGGRRTTDIEITSPPLSRLRYIRRHLLRVRYAVNV